jgi:hypothetical protein
MIYVLDGAGEGLRARQGAEAGARSWFTGWAAVRGAKVKEVGERFIGTPYVVASVAERWNMSLTCGACCCGEAAHERLSSQ